METKPGEPVLSPPLTRIGESLYELPPSYRADMRVPVRVFADDVLLEAILRDQSLTQLINVATLPGICGAALGMPDMHEGYGFPVGGVAATLPPDGVLSPGGIGFDINCGVRLLTTPLRREELAPQLAPLMHELSRSVPTGYGRAGKLALTDDELDRVLAEGCPYLIGEHGLGFSEDLDHTESGGCLVGADPSMVSARAKQRGCDQLGTLGGGNHFLELQVVDSIVDAATAAAFGLSVDQVVVLIHSGSRGLGHQVCTDFVRRMDEASQRFGIVLPDRQGAAGVRAHARVSAGEPPPRLRCRPQQREDRAPRRARGLRAPQGRDAGVRAGERYRGIGQPVLIPGSMGTASFVMVGTDASSELSLGSACHGAGRAMSRGAAKHETAGHLVRQELTERGIVIKCPSNAELAEEAPLAYKDVDRVVDTVHRAGIARKVARLRPIGVLKG